MTRRKTFTVNREPKEIELGGDVFTAPAIIPPISLGDLLDKLVEIKTVTAQFGESDVTHAESMKRLASLAGEAFDLVLRPESAARMRDRLHDQANPLDLIGEVMPAVAWLVDEYAGAPTSVASDGGSTDGGTP